jgi:CRP-like cAMP-binding protein
VPATGSTRSTNGARRLCITHDQVNGDAFSLTREFLAQMLGVRRSGVSDVAQGMQKDRLTRYARGRIEVLDRAGLEARPRDCNWIIRGALAPMLQAA